MLYGCEIYFESSFWSILISFEFTSVVNVIVVPSFFFDLTLIVPPRASVIALAVLNPMPTPCFTSSWGPLNVYIKLSCVLFVMPTPLSITRVLKRPIQPR